jgi:SAM-dependent methyltransferase
MTSLLKSMAVTTTLPWWSGAKPTCRMWKAVTNRLDPPLPYPDERFDLVYALSVFTHLTESQQRSWSAELHRVTRTCGYVLFTTHGPSFPHSDPSFTTPEIANRLANGELLVFEPMARWTQQLCAISIKKAGSRPSPREKFRPSCPYHTRSCHSTTRFQSGRARPC